MLKLILGLMILGASVNADIEVKMNKKALYLNSIDLMSENQQNYLYDYTDDIIKETNNILKKESKDLKKEKSIDESNAIEFNLYPDGNISNFSYLMRSNEGRFDRLTKKVCEEAVKKYPLPKEKTLIRLVFEYKIGKISMGNQKGSEQQKATGEYIQTIPRGTTRFEHSMSQQVRQFETTRDGYINISANPQICASFDLLTESNQRTGGMHVPWAINYEVPKGKYKLLVQTKETCNVNIQYP